MISGEQESHRSVVLSDWVRDVNRSLLRKLEEDLKEASDKDPGNDLLVRSMKEISILKSEVNRLESELNECSAYLQECSDKLEALRRTEILKIIPKEKNDG